MDKRARDLIEQGNHLFEKRSALMSLWQEIADNFYPERGHFTVSPTMGEDFASHLTTSYPLLARRELGDAFSAMLRPPGQEWFKMGLSREEREDAQGRAWLQEMTKRQRRAMYDRAACFIRATSEGDHDFAAFGQCAITVEYDRNAMAMLYRSWHLADVAWCEGANGRITEVHRKWKPTIRDLERLFPGKLHKTMVDAGRDKPYTEANIRHIVVPSDAYGEMDKKMRRLPFIEVYIDVDNQHVIEETPLFGQKFVIPRWKTVSGSQYATSPATVIALPDARLIQAMTGALLEASEKAANPPMAGVREAIRGDLDLRAGGFTALEADYDERLGEVLRPIATEWRGVPIGIEVSDRVTAMIEKAFFLNKLSMPPAGSGPEMTAFEVGQRVQQYIREAIPLFGPMETEYNGALCDSTFEHLLRNGAFGPANEMPKSLSGQEIQFRFESPLTEAIERKKGHMFLEAKGMLVQAAELDPSAVPILNAPAALRDVLRGLGTPEIWTRDEEAVAAMTAQQQEAQEGEEAMMAAQQGADVVATMANAAGAVQQPEQAVAA